jgi:hypothetical protein
MTGGRILDGITSQDDFSVRHGTRREAMGRFEGDHIALRSDPICSTDPRSAIQNEYMPQSSELREDIVVRRPASPRLGF